MQNQQQKQNTPKERHFQVVMPLDLGIRIGTDDSVRLLLEVTEGMDYRDLNAAYDCQTRAGEATPKQMFQLVVFVDGTKIEANANRYSFMWAKAVGKHESQLEEKLTVLLNRLTREYAIVLQEGTPPEAYFTALKERASGIAFVHGRGKRKTQLQRDIETLGEYTNATLRYGLMIASLGLEAACGKSRAVTGGVNVYDGRCTCRGVAEAFGIPCHALDVD